MPMNSEQKLFDRIPYHYLIKGMWALVILGVVIFIGLFVHVANTKMPDTKELENPKFEESSIVYSDDGVELDRYFQRNRQWVKYEDLNPHIVDALIATEDWRFFKHSGIDAKGTARAFAFLGKRGGASTITQQLAKQFFTEKRSTFFPRRVWQKMKEWVIAIEFERRYTKEEIIAMFLNKFDFRYQANGIGAAANIYFGKNQKDLEIPEAAMLIGMLKNPSYFNPLSQEERTRNRRTTVLSQMKKYNIITDEEYKLYRDSPMDLSNFSRGEIYDGLSPHFLAELKKEVRAILKKNNITKPGGEEINIDTDGLKIYTTIDSRYQKHAEAAAREHMINQQNKFHRVWKDADPWEYIKDREDLSEDQINRIKRSRQRELSELIEKTDRYKKLRFQFLNDVIKAISNDIPNTRLWSGDITRLLQAEKDDQYLARLVKTGTIRKDQRDVYNQILSSPHWDKLRSQWNALRSKAKKDFNQPRKMKVYSYSGPIEMNMSPLDSIKYMFDHLQIGSISMDPATGYIKSWVGGSDYEKWKYDHVRSERQVGSTFKPFLYTAALNNAISPCMKIRDVQYTIPEGDEFRLSESWSPKNTRGEFSGEEMTIKEGLKKSMNSVSVALLMELGSTLPIVSIAENMGITKGKIPNYPSIILGSPTLSVFDMTTAYSTFANDGKSPKPIFIKRIEYDGTIIYEEIPESKRVINSSVNYAMVELLKNASSFVSNQIESEFGGKTGTTNDHIDGWFMGISPTLVTGTWVGGERSWIRFLNINEGQGGQMARPFFVKYMQLLESDASIDFDTKAMFKVPEDLIVTNCDAYEQLIPPDDDLDDEIEMEDEIEE